jgi:hypothetical protein
MLIIDCVNVRVANGVVARRACGTLLDILIRVCWTLETVAASCSIWRIDFSCIVYFTVSYCYLHMRVLVWFGS